MIIVFFSFCSIFLINCRFPIFSHQLFVATSKVCTCKLIAQVFCSSFSFKTYLFWKHCLCSLPYFTAQKSFCLLKYNNTYCMFIFVTFNESMQTEICLIHILHILPSFRKDKYPFVFFWPAYLLLCPQLFNSKKCQCSTFLYHSETMPFNLILKRKVCVEVSSISFRVELFCFWGCIDLGDFWETHPTVYFDTRAVSNHRQTRADKVCPPSN